MKALITKNGVFKAELQTKPLDKNFGFYIRDPSKHTTLIDTKDSLYEITQVFDKWCDSFRQQGCEVKVKG